MTGFVWCFIFHFNNRREMSMKYILLQIWYVKQNTFPRLLSSRNVFKLDICFRKRKALLVQGSLGWTIETINGCSAGRTASYSYRNTVWTFTQVPTCKEIESIKFNLMLQNRFSSGLVWGVEDLKKSWFQCDMYHMIFSCPEQLNRWPCLYLAWLVGHH